MKPRFFILKGSKLFFSEDEKKAPHGMIDLVDCVSVKPHGDNATIEIATRSEAFVLIADSYRGARYMGQEHRQPSSRQSFILL